MAKKGTKAYQPIKVDKKSKQVILPKGDILGFHTRQAVDIIKGKPSYPFTQVQLDWIKALREHPERQLRGTLGCKATDGYHLCCLGQALLCLNPGIEFDKESGTLRDISDNSAEDSESIGILVFSYPKLGLRSASGKLVTNYTYNDGGQHTSLASMNDGGVTWPEIADYIEQNPENVFTNHLKDFYNERPF